MKSLSATLVRRLFRCALWLALGGGLLLAQPVITTNSPLPNGAVGEAYSLNFMATGGVPPYTTWSLSQGTLPAGLFLNVDTGALFGTPTTAGTSNFTIEVFDSQNQPGSKAFVLTINPSLAITTNSPLPSGTQNAAYAQTLAASGGVPPYTWSVVQGPAPVVFPPGLSLNASTGEISGTPTAAGTYNFTIQVADSNQVTAAKAFALTINPPLTITTGSPLPSGAIGAAYAQILSVSGGTPPYAWLLTSGALPAGLLLNAATGQISGTPTVAGTANFTIQVTDTNIAIASKAFALTINSPPTITTSSPLPSGTAFGPYLLGFAATGGTPPYTTWTVSQGALPAGLTLNPSLGVLSGTPIAAGTSNFTIEVFDSLNAAGSKAFVLTINAPPKITSISPLPSGSVGTAYAHTLSVSGGTPPYRWSVTAGALPAGLTLNPSTGQISGTPAAASTSNFTIQLADTNQVTTTEPFVLTIALTQIPSISSLNPSSIAAGTKSLTLTVNGTNFIGPNLGIIWKPETGNSTFISGQANSAATQLTATIQATLISSSGTVSVSVQAAGSTSNAVTFLITGSSGGNPVATGHLVFPNAGLSALQEFDPVSRSIVNTIPLPVPFTYSGSPVLETARVRAGDHGIVINAYVNGGSAVVALSSSGHFVAAALPTGLVQQLVLDPLDVTQSTVLAGNPPASNAVAVNPYADSIYPRIIGGSPNYTGLAVDAVNNLYVGDSASGQIIRYLPNGTQTGLFADVLKTTGSSEINGIAIDASNNVYVAQSSSNRIAAFNATGSFTGFLTNQSFHENASVYFNANDGLLYAGNQADDALIVLTTSGEPVAVVHMGGQSIGVPDLVPGAPVPTQAGMEASQSGLLFQVPQGSISPAPQSFVLVNYTSAAVSYTASVSTVSGGSWLSVSGGSGSVAAGLVSAPLTVSVNPSGLGPGDYYGMIQIDAPSAPNTPEFVTVVLNVLASTANPGPTVTPTGLVFTAAGAQSVQISNVLSRSTSFSATVSGMFTVSPSQASIMPGQTVSVQVLPNAGLETGIYRGTLTLQFPQDNVNRSVDLLLVVAAGATQSSQIRGAPQQASTACTPAQLLLVFSQLGASFNQAAGWPTDVEVTVVDDCAGIVTSGSVTVTFSDGDPFLTLTSLQDGRWSGTWTPLSLVTPSVTLTATALDPRGLKGSTQISGTVQTNPDPDVPVLNPGRMVSAASYSPTAMPSPGETVAIFGTHLADAVESAPPGEYPLPMVLQNAFILLGGVPMPLLYVSQGQINTIVPFEIAGGTAHQAIARNGKRLSIPQRFRFAAAEPAIFTTNESGQGQGYIYAYPNEKDVADSSAPAKAGDVLTIYCTGLGAVTPPVQDGVPPGSNPLKYTANSVSVTIGGQPVSSANFFAGLNPQDPGLYQVNATIPTGVPTGNQIPIVITVAGVSSPPVTMAVK